MQTTVKQLRSSTREILGAVSRGDSVTITRRGRACARIVPVKKSKSTSRQNRLFGIWKDHKQVGTVAAYVRALRKGRWA